MGLIADALRAVLPRTTTAVAATIPTWEQGRPRQQPLNYETYAREGYSQNEIVFAAVEERITSVAAARFEAWTDGDESEQVKRHPAITLLRNPNPFLSRNQLIGGIELYLCLAGNAYLEKVRSRSGKVVELWPLRPDRMRVIPDATRYIGGYEYTLGERVFTLPARDVIHLKTRNPLDDFYGMSLLQPAAGKIDIANQMTLFQKAFFTNAGVPAGLLVLKHALEEGDKGLLRTRFRHEYGGAAGWHTLMVLDNAEPGEVKFEPMGLGMGPSGLDMAGLSDGVEAGMVAPLGVPLSLIGARLGYSSSSYANRVSDRQEFTKETIVPELDLIGAALTMGLLAEFGGADRIGFDQKSLPELQEDADKKHTRLREDLKAGGISLEEYRKETGRNEDIDERHVFFVPTGTVPTPGSELTAKALEAAAEEADARAEAMQERLLNGGGADDGGDEQQDGETEPVVAGQPGRNGTQTQRRHFRLE